MCQSWLDRLLFFDWGAIRGETGGLLERYIPKERIFAYRNYRWLCRSRKNSSQSRKNSNAVRIESDY
ncbi:hypothetical protein OUZ56_003750 [Daphnia magna]|uniref:Uncharacterized protein n=1 Tax=Daphnia magna TaxID=35525 RepID=A0ABR0A9M6_9CRUS|nr:hypothetical protein OUZ56_003750 [Daphnia magna]